MDTDEIARHRLLERLRLAGLPGQPMQPRDSARISNHNRVTAPALANLDTPNLRIIVCVVRVYLRILNALSPGCWSG